MKMTKAEAGRIGAANRLRNATAEQRKETARLGGLARAASMSHEQRVALGKLGGRPKKVLKHPLADLQKALNKG